MEKIKHSPAETLKNIIIVLLILSMLVLAVIYIGGSQLAMDNTALNASELPSGFVAAGADKEIEVAMYEKALLPMSYVGIKYGDGGGGVYSNEAAADSLTEFAYEYIHACLESSGSLEEISLEEFAAAFDGNFIVVNLSSSLPYQIIYALTGEYNSVVGSSSAVSADRLVICEKDRKLQLLLSDGERAYASSAVETAGASEMSALANDSRLSHFSVTESGITLSSLSPETHKISFSQAQPFDIPRQRELIELFGYDSNSSSAQASSTLNLFSPLGTLQINMQRISYFAAQESGIPLSGFLAKSKNDIDIGIYDVLYASFSFVESLCDIAPEQLGSPLSPQLRNFYYSGGTYTLIFDLACDGIGVYGETYPYFAKITVAGGRFKSIDVNLIGVVREGYTSPTFPSDFNYNYALKKEGVRSIFMKYPVDSVPAQNLSPMWYYMPEGGDER